MRLPGVTSKTLFLSGPPEILTRCQEVSKVLMQAASRHLSDTALKCHRLMNFHETVRQKKRRKKSNDQKDCFHSSRQPRMPCPHNTKPMAAQTKSHAGQTLAKGGLAGWAHAGGKQRSLGAQRSHEDKAQSCTSTSSSILHLFRHGRDKERV